MKRSEPEFTNRKTPYRKLRPAPAAGTCPLAGARLTACAAAILTAAFVWFWSSGDANAQWAACGTRDSVVERLKIGFKETEAGYGLTGSGMIAELFVSEAGSWTIVITRPDGISCLVAAGQSWEMKPLAPRTTAPDPAS